MNNMGAWCPQPRRLQFFQKVSTFAPHTHLEPVSKREYGQMECGLQIQKQGVDDLEDWGFIAKTKFTLVYHNTLKINIDHQ